MLTRLQLPVTVALAGVGRVVIPESEATVEDRMSVPSRGQMETDNTPRRSECVTQQPAKLLDAVDAYVAPSTPLRKRHANTRQ